MADRFDSLFEDMEAELEPSADLYDNAVPSMSDREILFRIWWKLRDPAGDIPLLLGIDYDVLIKRYRFSMPLIFLSLYHSTCDWDSYMEEMPEKDAAGIVRKIFASGDPELVRVIPSLLCLWREAETPPLAVKAVKDLADELKLTIPEDRNTALDTLDALERKVLIDLHDRSKRGEKLGEVPPPEPNLADLDFDELVDKFPSTSPLTYRESAAANVGTRLQHPTFGEGVVVHRANDKMKIVFKDGQVRLLRVAPPLGV